MILKRFQATANFEMLNCLNQSIQAIFLLCKVMVQKGMAKIC